MNADTPKTLDLYIYTDVESDYWDWGTGEQVESQTSAEHIRRELEAAGDVTQINIYINSLGGSVMRAWRSIISSADTRLTRRCTLTVSPVR